MKYLPTEVLCPAEVTTESLDDEEITLRGKLMSNRGELGDHRN